MLNQLKDPKLWSKTRKLNIFDLAVPHPVWGMVNEVLTSELIGWWSHVWAHQRLIQDRHLKGGVEWDFPVKCRVVTIAETGRKARIATLTEGAFNTFNQIGSKFLFELIKCDPTLTDGLS